MSFDPHEEFIRSRLDDYYQRYEAGERHCLIFAMRFCGLHKVVMPDWVADAFISATDRYYRYEVKELASIRQ